MQRDEFSLYAFLPSSIHTLPERLGILDTHRIPLGTNAGTLTSIKAFKPPRGRGNPRVFEASHVTKHRLHTDSHTTILAACFPPSSETCLLTIRPTLQLIAPYYSVWWPTEFDATGAKILQNNFACDKCHTICGDMRRSREDEYNGRASTRTPRWPWRKWESKATTLRAFFVREEEERKSEQEREEGESGVDGWMDDHWKNEVWMKVDGLDEILEHGRWVLNGYFSSQLLRVSIRSYIEV